MAEIKRTFAKAKMNKDIDERILPPGEYRHAINVQAKGSDGSDSGALQNIMGNSLINTPLDISGAEYYLPSDSTCVGAVSNPAADNIFYLVSARTVLPAATDAGYTGYEWAPQKDMVVEMSSDGKISYVFVDIHAVSCKMPAVSGTTWDTSTHAGLIDSLRVGMSWGLNNANGQEVQIKSISGTTITFTDTISEAEGVVTFQARRVLELPEGGLITGINILDDFLCWTDNEHEPKCINIDRSKRGTGLSSITATVNGNGKHAKRHTALVIESHEYLGQLFAVQNDDETHYIPVKWRDVSVMKQSPKTALRLDTSTTEEKRTNNLGEELNTFGQVSNLKIHGGLYGVGDYIEDAVFDSPVAFRFNDKVEFNVVGEGSIGEVAVTARVSYSPYTSANQSEGVNLIKFEVLSISAELIDVFYNWTVVLSDKEPLFDTKFARFSYRWKYHDGQYSAFAPWTQPAFLPGFYGYYAQNGFNTGMESRLKGLFLTDYISKEIPDEVVEIELLYKETNNPTVYTIDSVSQKDKSAGWTDNNPQGRFPVKTDMVHAVVPSNQLLRPYDNVPRRALAQEVSANRIIYGNYLQNFDVFEKPSVQVNINKSIVDDLEGVPSIKSRRHYQMGLVWHDELGRETPVLKIGQRVLDKSYSPTANSISAKLNTTCFKPSWATHYSFYIKEPTVEYYNLGMDRWYNAADGNIWISFPSSERNKITDETFLSLKKAHGNNIAVVNSPDYKVLSIKNEAPDFIKTLYKKQGWATNSSDVFNIGTAQGGYPLIGMRVITIDENATSLSDSLSADMLSKSWRLRFWDQADPYNTKSRFYDVDRISQSDGKYHFHLRIAIGNDCAFATEPGLDNIYANKIEQLKCQIYAGEIKNRPEFDGRFFVKIKRDATVETHIIANGQLDDWLVYDTIPVSYLNNKFMEGNGEYPWKSRKTETGLTLDNTHPTETLYGSETAYQWGSSANFIDSDLFDITDKPISTINGDESKPFWEWINGKKQFFIDACSAYSWNGRNLPGSRWDDALNFNGTGELYEETMLNQFPWAKAGNLPCFNEGNGWNNYVSNGGPAYFDSAEIGPWTISDGMGGSTSVDPFAANGSRGMWNSTPPGVSWGHGFMDISWAGFETISDVDVTQETLSGNSGDAWDTYNGTPIPRPTLHDQVVAGGLFNAPDYMHDAWDLMKKLLQFGRKFRFRNDPDQVEYEVGTYQPSYNGSNPEYNVAYWNAMEIPYNGEYAKSPSNFAGQGWDVQESDFNYMNGMYGIKNWGNLADPTLGFMGMDPQYDGMNFRQKWTLKVTPKFGSGYHGYMPTTGTQIDQDEHPGAERVRALHHDSTNLDYIELLEPATVDDDGNDMSSGFVSNPAVFETKPRESVDIDIYYQMSDIIPISLGGERNYDLIPRRSTFTYDGHVYMIKSWNRSSLNIETGSSVYETTLQDNIDGFIKITTPNGRVSEVKVTGSSGSTRLIVDVSEVASTNHYLNWSNCWAFGNGVESDRVRDDYNAKQMDNGVKASTVLAGPVKSERRSSGIIWSGLHNSTSGVNDINQFIMAEPITKDVNPTHGSIQRLLNRETRLVAFCENKVLRADTNKDALYNADGSKNVVASNTVVGDFSPYTGNHGISRNPESLAVSSTSSYFTDADRGQVLALYNNGIQTISAGGMESFFKDFPEYTSLLGTFDEDTLEYNLTAKGHSNYTVSYGEITKTWISFKSFIPEYGVSLNNRYYTFLNGELWKHHNTSEYGKFYGTGYPASVTTVFGGSDGGVKSFNTINYEGTKAAINSSSGSTVDTLTGDYSINGGLESDTVYDGEYFNLNTTKGWYAEYIKTDLQDGGSVYFKNKEGKYFGVPKGKVTTVVNTSNISVQGLGTATVSHGSGGDSGEVVITVSNSSTSPTGTNWD